MPELSPAEAWDAAEEQIELWREDRRRQERKKWAELRGW